MPNRGIAILGESGYRALHAWVAKHLGKPQKCDVCGTTEKKRYHWANISQEYKKDLSDWRRMCVVFHQRGFEEKRDFSGFANETCKMGHFLTEDNLYTSPDGFMECRECRKIGHKKSNAKSNPLRSKPLTPNKE